MNFDHVDPRFHHLLGKSAADRISVIQAGIHWIGYPRALAGLKKLKDLLARPRRPRMPNMLLCGETNNGKSTLARKFIANQGPPTDWRDGTKMEVIALDVSRSADVASFYVRILQKLNAPTRPSRSIAVLEADVVHYLRVVGAKILLIDEIHNILASTRNMTDVFLNVLRFIGNELQLSIVGIGTRKALQITQTDEQAANRFHPFALPRWQNDEDYLSLLDSLERVLPLHLPSDLSERGLAGRILDMSEGILGEIIEVVTLAAIQALETGAERIVPKLLSEIDFTKPSRRRPDADGLLAN